MLKIKLFYIDSLSVFFYNHRDFFLKIITYLHAMEIHENEFYLLAPQLLKKSFLIKKKMHEHIHIFGLILLILENDCNFLFNIISDPYLMECLVH